MKLFEIKEQTLKDIVRSFKIDAIMSVIGGLLFCLFAFTHWTIWWNGLLFLFASVTLLVSGIQSEYRRQEYVSGKRILKPLTSKKCREQVQTNVAAIFCFEAIATFFLFYLHSLGGLTIFLLVNFWSLLILGDIHALEVKAKELELENR